MTRSPNAESYFAWLLTVGRDCDHPPEFRRPIPDVPSFDPSEWECEVCGTWQVRKPPAPPSHNTAPENPR